MLSATNILIITLAFALFASPVLSLDSTTITYGSALRMKSKGGTDQFIHSHDIPYGSGSKGNSVTGFPNHDDPNNLIQILPSSKAKLSKYANNIGDPIFCGDTVQLLHSSTNRRVCINDHASMLSPQLKEVAGIPIDQVTKHTCEYTVQCVRDASPCARNQCKGGKELITTDTDFTLQDVKSKKYLSCTSKMYPQPIHGQREIAGTPRASRESEWRVVSGYIFEEDYSK